ncbi:hypothetical protein LZ30DRAFT_342897 [Colletotrichum cereale]|nr:hypothetical protein LZ30DRAFT_342897 [Colletotrichum cereale]
MPARTAENRLSKDALLLLVGSCEGFRRVHCITSGLGFCRLSAVGNTVPEITPLVYLYSPAFEPFIHSVALVQSIEGVWGLLSRAFVLSIHPSSRRKRQLLCSILSSRLFVNWRVFVLFCNILNNSDRTIHISLRYLPLSSVAASSPLPPPASLGPVEPCLECSLLPSPPVSPKTKPPRPPRHRLALAILHLFASQSQPT